jgi:hypothetical protein
MLDTRQYFFCIGVSRYGVSFESVHSAHLDLVIAVARCVACPSPCFCDFIPLGFFAWCFCSSLHSMHAFAHTTFSLFASSASYLRSSVVMSGVWPSLSSRPHTTGFFTRCLYLSLRSPPQHSLARAIPLFAFRFSRQVLHVLGKLTHDFLEALLCASTTGQNTTFLSSQPFTAHAFPNASHTHAHFPYPREAPHLCNKLWLLYCRALLCAPQLAREDVPPLPQQFHGLLAYCPLLIVRSATGHNTRDSIQCAISLFFSQSSLWDLHQLGAGCCLFENTSSTLSSLSASSLLPKNIHPLRTRHTHP